MTTTTTTRRRVRPKPKHKLGRNARSTTVWLESYELTRDELLDYLMDRVATHGNDADFARLSGVSVSTLRKWRSRTVWFPRLDTIYRVAKALGIRRLTITVR